MSQIPYTDAHRFIAQKFVTCGPAYRKDVNRFITEAAKATKVQLGQGDQDLVKIFQAINNKLAPLNIKIQRTTNELNGSACYVLTNLNTKEVVDWKTDYTDKELDFISKVFAELAKSETRELCRADFYKIANGCKISGGDCDHIITGLKDTAYLTTDVNQGGSVETYGFGVRVVAELYDYMARNYSDVLPQCGTCKRLVFNRGDSIECQQCEATSTFHTGCRKKNAAPSQPSQQGHGLSCVSCHAPLVFA